MSTAARTGWVEGPVLTDLRLAADVYEHWLAAGALAGAEPDPGRAVPADVDGACSMVDDAAALLVAELERPDARAGHHVRAAKLLVAGNRLAVQAREAGVQWRAHAFGQVHAALGRLRGATTVEQLMRMGPEELCKCGFDRAMLSRVDGELAVPQAFFWVGDPERAAEVVRKGQEHPMQLTHTQLETEMIRRRSPLLVQDVQADPRVHRLLVGEGRDTRCYVAAPIMPQGKVIGFLHADCQEQQRIVDGFDRDLLWMFAEGFGFAYERTILLERLRSLRNEVRRGNRSVMGVMDQFVEAEVEVSRVEREARSVAHSAGALLVGGDSRIEALLTRRELDVIRLMATGETNAGIALKLIVSEGTVKSHVKHILRKLRASNRAEAVSRYIRLSQQAPMSEDD